MNRSMIAKAELVVATSGVPTSAYLLSSGQVWSGIKTVNISATASTITNESTIRMTPGLSNFSEVSDRQLDAVMAAIFVMAYFNGRTHVYWKGTEVRGIELVYFGSDIVSRETDIKLVTADATAVSNIDTLRHPWVWVKSAASALTIANVATA